MSDMELDFDDDAQWGALTGGRGLLCDPRATLRTLEQDGDVSESWRQLWDALYHQGDVGTASYAAVPHLVRIGESSRSRDANAYALIAAMELARDNPHNPRLPAEFAAAYDLAWRRLSVLALKQLEIAQQALLVTHMLGVLAIAKGQRALGWFACELTEDERDEILTQSR